LCQNNRDCHRLELEAFGLHKAGKHAEAKEKYLQAFNQLRDTRPIEAAEMLFMAGICAPPDEAAEYFQTVSSLSLREREFQFAITALEHAMKCHRQVGNTDEIKEIDKRIETIKKEMPHNLEECFTELKRQLTSEQLQTFKNVKESDIIRYHLGLGMWIRNSWGLWAGSDLAASLGKMGCHPDRMSNRILTEFHRYLNKEPEARRGPAEAKRNKTTQAR